jgi:penicillin-binding protein 1A
MAQDGRGRGDGPKLTRDKPIKKTSVRAEDVSPRATRMSGKRPETAASASPKKSAPYKGKPKTKKRRDFYVDNGSLMSRLWRWLISPGMLVRYASAAMTLMICVLMMLIYFSRDLPDISHLKSPLTTIGIQVLDARGTVMARYGNIYGDKMRYSEFPQDLIDAVVATEDRNYYDHFGIDVWGIFRAMLVNIREGQMVQGGSTITQQLAKNVFLSPDKTFKRKVQEMMLAVWLESRYSKKDILSIYLNRVYLGAGNFGVDAASRFYFGHPASQLTLSESALIAGLLKAPSRYNPIADEDRARGRAKQVLLNMVDADLLKQEEAEYAMQDLQFATRQAQASVSNSARYYADWVMEELSDYVGTVQDDIIIHTSLDPIIQAQADAALAEQFSSDIRAKDNASQAALIAMRPTGEVVALIGGIDYDTSEYNRATQARRQPGSAFKLFVYVTAMEMGYGPDSMVEDSPVRIGKWQPKNYKGEYRGAIPMREAVAQSINTVAVKLTQEAGVQRVINTARRMGITTPISPSPSIALGSVEVSPLELTVAYAHLASGGHMVKPWGIRKIVRVKDNQTIYQQDGIGEGTVLSSDTVAKMNQMFSGVIGWGTGKNAALGRPAAGKTGTTSDYKDAWFMGYTTQLVTGVWVGNDNATPMNKVTGGALPAKIWRSFMSAALKDMDAAPLPSDYNDGFFSLPWLQSDRSSSQPAPVAVEGDKAQSQGKQGGDGSLGKSFWDKLFDGDDVQHTYPSSGKVR